MIAKCNQLPYQNVLVNKCETKPVDMNTTAGIALINQGLVRGTKIMFNATTNKYEDKIVSSMFDNGMRWLGVGYVS